MCRVPMSQYNIVLLRGLHNARCVILAEGRAKVVRVEKERFKKDSFLDFSRPYPLIQYRRYHLSGSS